MITFSPEGYHQLNILSLEKDPARSIWSGRTSMSFILNNMVFPDIIITKDEEAEVGRPLASSRSKFSDSAPNTGLLHVENNQSSLDL